MDDEVDDLDRYDLEREKERSRISEGRGEDERLKERRTGGEGKVSFKLEDRVDLQPDLLNTPSFSHHYGRRLLSTTTTSSPSPSSHHHRASNPSSAPLRLPPSSGGRRPSLPPFLPSLLPQDLHLLPPPEPPPPLRIPNDLPTRTLLHPPDTESTAHLRNLVTFPPFSSTSETSPSSALGTHRWGWHRPWISRK